jgi:hypothetical protein
VTTATYRSVAPASPAGAQAALRGHVAGLDGRCLTCRVAGPCLIYLVSVWVLNQYGCLPRREPGATRADAVARRHHGSGFGWWDVPGDRPPAADSGPALPAAGATAR